MSPYTLPGMHQAPSMDAQNFIFMDWGAAGRADPVDTAPYAYKVHADPTDTALSAP